MRWLTNTGKRRGAEGNDRVALPWVIPVLLFELLDLISSALIARTGDCFLLVLTGISVLLATREEHIRNG